MKVTRCGAGFLLSAVASSKPEVRSLLLVDDDTGLCNLMAEFLSPYHFRLTSTHDGVTGLSRAMAGGFDLILLDIMLPILDGLEVLKRLRENKVRTPIIMLTARTAHRDRIAGLDAGADDYIPKPFAPHELLARIRAVLRRTHEMPTALPRLSPLGKFAWNLGGARYGRAGSAWM